METIQMHLSQKKKKILIFFVRFSNLHPILNMSKKKDEPHTLCISEITDPQRRG